MRWNQPRIYATFAYSPKKPIQPPEIIRSIIDIDPLEAARQLTIHEFQLFRKISPREFLSMQWTKPNRKEKSPNLVTFIDHFEFTSSWVMREILKESDLDVRVATLSHIINIADVCLVAHFPPLTPSSI